MPTNTAAWLMSSHAPLEVKPAPYTSPKENQIVIKNCAVAINPVDWVKRDTGSMVFPWIKCPFILGTDVAGEVVEIGHGVTRFQVGDRVVGLASGQEEKINDPAQSGFQKYTVLLVHMTCHIPNALSYERAAVLPLGLSTAACGLFQEDQLNLQYPSVPPPKPTGKSLLVWGGSTSVGLNAIQLAVAAGYEVITTCSPKNFAYVKHLGASQVFDYNSMTIINDLIHAFKGKTTAGALAIGHQSGEACLDILDKCNGNKFVSMATYPIPSPAPQSLVLLKTASYYLSHTALLWYKSKSRNIGTKFIFGFTLIHNGVGKAVFMDFLPKALAGGTYVSAPDPQVVGEGVEFIQAALEVQKRGMSAKKVVVSL